MHRLMIIALFVVTIPYAYCYNPDQSRLDAQTAQLQAEGQKFLKHPNMLKEEHAYIYIPQALRAGNGVRKDVKHTIVVVFSRLRDPETFMPIWIPLADKYNLIIYFCQLYRNRDDLPFWKVQFVTNDIMRCGPIILEALQRYNIDPDRIIAAGMGGAGAFAYASWAFLGTLPRGFIVNNGRIPAEGLQKIKEANAMVNQELKLQGFHPSKKFVAMIVCPSFFRYKEIKSNHGVFAEMGWETNWIEYKDNLPIAPLAYYETALRWVLEGMSAKK